MGLLTKDRGVFGNRYDTQASMNKSMMDNAFKWGALSSPRYSGMAASEALQADMYGRSLGMMLGGQDPMMQKQNLVDEIMRKHPDPRTPEELDAVANDFQSADLNDMAMQIRGVADEVRKTEATKNKASQKQIETIGSKMMINQGSDPMLDMWLTKLNPTWDDFNDTEKASARKDVRGQFKGIVDTYVQWLTTQDLSPRDVNRILFQSEGQQQNIGMFKDYLATIKDTNPFAEHLYNTNQQMFLEMTGGTDVDTNDSPMNKVEEIDKTGTESSDVYVNSTMSNEDKPLDERSDFEKLQIKNATNMEILDALDKTWKSMFDWITGAEGYEMHLTPDELREEQQEDEVQEWIRKSGFKHFQALPKERLEAFVANPRGYYKQNILMEDGKVRDDLEQEVIKLWAL